MDGDNKKSGFRKRTKPKEVGFDSDDEPIGSLLKLKRSRNSKKSKLGVDHGCERDKMVDNKEAKLQVQEEDFGGMEDTLASFRKKLRRPKKAGGLGIAREQSSALGVAETLDPLSNASSRGQGDLDTTTRPSNGELMDPEESDPSANINVERRCEAPDLELKGMEMGISSRKIANCSIDKQLDDSLSAFVQKVQSGSIRKSLASRTFKLECKDGASGDKLCHFSRVISGNHETYSAVSSNSSANLAQGVKKQDSELTASYLISCSRCTRENCNPGLGQCRGVEGDQEEYQCGLNNHENTDIGTCTLSKVTEHIQSRDDFQALERKVSCEMENGVKHHYCGDTMGHSHLAEMVSFQDGLGENHLNENMHSAGHALEPVNESHVHCGGVSSGDFCVAQEPTATLSKTTSGVDCEEKDRLLVVHHEELPNSTKFCESSSKEICKSTQNLKISDQSSEGTTLSNLQLLAAFESMKVDKTFSDSDNLNTETNDPNTKVDYMQKENSLISHRIQESTAVQSHRSQNATTFQANYLEICPIGNFSMISNSQPAKTSVEIDGQSNILGKEVNASSPGSLTPDDIDLEDVISAPGSEKDLKLSALQRVARKTKKPRHDDMAYEGEIDWEVLINERAVDSDHSVRSRKDSTSTTSTEAETGSRAAVSAGLKAHAVSLLEKIKFKEVLKRKGGLQDYLACRYLLLNPYIIIPCFYVTLFWIDCFPPYLVLCHSYLFLYLFSMFFSIVQCIKELYSASAPLLYV